jgi:hypothetical protein
MGCNLLITRNDLEQMQFAIEKAETDPGDQSLAMSSLASTLAPVLPVVMAMANSSISQALQLAAPEGQQVAQTISIDMEEQFPPDIKQAETAPLDQTNTISTTASVIAPLIPVAMKMASSAIGRAVWKAGLEGETVSKQVLLKSLNVEPVKHTKYAQGFDDVMQSLFNPLIVVEVKTSIRDVPFQQFLKKGYGHKQCSTEWVRAVANKMLGQENENPSIGKKILSNPNEVTVLGVHINPTTQTASVYVRADSTAKKWELVIKNLPL